MEPEPEDLNRWVAAGFARGEAASWRRWRFTIDLARSWISAGVGTGLSAAQWAIAGVNPDTVGQWREAGIQPQDAVRWHEFGIGLEQARRYRAQGVTPDQAWQRGQQAEPGADAEQATRRFREAGVTGALLSSYVLRQWLDEQALEWARHGVDAGDARAWLDLGLTPAEGAELSRAGQEPMAVIRAWWRTGVPFEEVADWLGAGFDPEEAARRRAAGITARQAAALRELRRHQGLPEV
ncbi:hypothetical protein GCM10010174_84180 [Kutzneria viridogrisea]|uniref:Uncharacterized protein n=1 Tax=Kutzneria viridogrisea TaxID=47990 RepID=A0ABR6BF36_9PSEU|nr:hypothetical protein [Kutzneria viridogrisea]